MKPAAAPSPDSASLDGERIEITRRGGKVHAWCAVYGLHASAATADEALAQLDARLADLRRFEAASGLDAASRLRRPETGSPFRGFLARIGVPVLVGGLIAMQLGWAISLGLSNGLGRAFDARWRDSLVLSLERQLLALAEPKEELSREQQERLIKAARALRQRYGPVWNELSGAPPSGPR